jgi:hypothetical protein
MRIEEDISGMIAKDNNVRRSGAGVANNAACFLPRRDAQITRGIRGRRYATARLARERTRSVDTCSFAPLS